MKYLKKFNESSDQEISGTLKDILLELEDDGFNIDFSDDEGVDTDIEINIYKERTNDEELVDPDNKKYLEEFSYREIADVVERIRSYMRSVSSNRVYWKFTMDSWELSDIARRLSDEKIKVLYEKDIKKKGFTIEFNKKFGWTDSKIHIKESKIFEAKTRDKSFIDTAKDILADLTDEGVSLQVNSSADNYTITIRHAHASEDKQLSLNDKSNRIDVSVYLKQLVSYFDDYRLVDLYMRGRKAKSEHQAKGGRLTDHLSIVERIAPREVDINHILDEYSEIGCVIEFIEMRFVRSNTSIFNYKLENKEAHILHDDEDKTVILDRYLIGLARIYYIHFKKSKIGTLRMNYLLNSRSTDNYRVYDNFGGEIQTKMIPVYLSKNDVDYGVFNDAWYYIEDDFNNQGYTN